MTESRHRSPSLRFLPLLLGVCALATPCVSGADSNRTGAEIYREHCARCHGPNGEGMADKHDEPLHGDRSVESLAKLIGRTMPEDTPEKCTDEDAAKVARFIFDAFYSPQARARTHPAKIQLSRLTVRQYLNSVADLVGSFRSPGEPLDAKRGLTGQYYNARNFRSNAKAFERIDPRIEFAFGEETPDPEKLTTNEFSIRWRGSVIAEDTGDYEFCLKTENGARLWVNDEAKTLIDAWVSSGTEIREHRETIRLLGGRTYPIQVDHFKFKDKTASITLQWKPPHRGWETIPQRNLTPSRAAETLVVTTAFPADDSSVGYERGTSVSKSWDQAATSAAIEVSNTIVEQLDSLAGTKADAPDRTERLKGFCVRFAERAFRRPLSDGQKHFFVEAQFERVKEPENAVKRVVLLVLKSPRFLYPEIGGSESDDYDVASRLAFGLWDSRPDQELLEAAAQGRLRTSEEISAQAQRMLQNPRTKTKLRDFFHHWLKMDEAEDVSKDPKTFPDFNETVLSDLRTSLDTFLEHVVWSEASDYRQLLLAEYLFLNGRLAKFYGVEIPSHAGSEPLAAVRENSAAPPQNPENPIGRPIPKGEGRSEAKGDVGPGNDGQASNSGETAHSAGERLIQHARENDIAEPSDFKKIAFDSKQRSGVVTHPYLLSAFAYHKSSSPIHRGVFLTRNIVGRALKPPPMAIQFMDGRFDPSLTMREKVAELTSPISCQGCHSVINPLGFSLEHYDAVGRFRTIDNQKPVDAASDYPTADGDVVRFTGARDVAEYAVKNEHAHRAFIRQLFDQTAKQPVEAYGPETLENLRRSFAASEYNIQKLLLEIVKVSALHGIKEPKTGQSGGVK